MPLNPRQIQEQFIVASETEPTSPSEGQIWVNTETGVTSQYINGQWEQLGLEIDEDSIVQDPETGEIRVNRPAQKIPPFNGQVNESYSGPEDEQSLTLNIDGWEVYMYSEDWDDSEWSVNIDNDERIYFSLSTWDSWSDNCGGYIEKDNVIDVENMETLEIEIYWYVSSDTTAGGGSGHLEIGGSQIHSFSESPSDSSESEEEKILIDVSNDEGKLNLYAQADINHYDNENVTYEIEIRAKNEEVIL